MVRIVKLERFTPFAIFKPSEESSFEKPKYRIKTYLSLTEKKEEFIQSLQNKKCKCMGVVIMLNPGSSEPEGVESTWRDGEIVKAKADDTMKQIERCVLEAYGDNPPSEGYIEIFNLFNLCEPTSQEAIKKYKEDKNKQFMITTNLVEKIKDETPWIWVAWGCDKGLQDRKKEEYEKIKNKFCEKIIKFEGKNNKYGFWHPLQYRDSRKKNILIQNVVPQIQRAIFNSKS